MAIMSVNRPEAPREKEKKEDDFDRLIKGLQIAQSITGIATNYHQIQASKLQQQRMDQELKSGEIALKKQQALEAGQITPDMELQITPLPFGTPGAREGVLARTGEKISFKTPQDVQMDMTLVKQATDKFNKDLEIAAAKSKDARELSLAMADKTEKHPTTISLAARYNAVNEMKRTGLTDKPTAASDMALIFQYMKTLDTTSTVREGEYASAKNAAGVPDQIINMYNRAVDGTMLRPDQRQHMVDVAEGILLENALAYRKTVAEPAIAKANQYGANPTIVVNPAWMQIADELEKKFSQPRPVQQQPSQNYSAQPQFNIESTANADKSLQSTVSDVNNKIEIMQKQMNQKPNTPPKFGRQ